MSPLHTKQNREPTIVAVPRILPMSNPKHTMSRTPRPYLTGTHIDQLRRDGYCILRGAVEAQMVAECATRLIEELGESSGIDISEPSSYRHLGSYHRADFHAGGVFDRLNSPAVIDALDTLIGRGRYQRPTRHGFFWLCLPGCYTAPWLPPRYCGRWHIDHGQFAVQEFNVANGSCAVVPIWLLTDVRPGGGATCGFRGSHTAVARILARGGPVPANEFDAFTESYAMNHLDDLVELTGRAGDVVFAHPFFIHGATGNVRERIRVICNTGIALNGARRLSAQDGELSPIEQITAGAIGQISGQPSHPWSRYAYRLSSALQDHRSRAADFDTRRVWDDVPAGRRGLTFWSATLGLRACGLAIELLHAPSTTTMGRFLARFRPRHPNHRGVENDPS